MATPREVKQLAEMVRAQGKAMTAGQALTGLAATMQRTSQLIAAANRFQQELEASNSDLQSALALHGNEYLEGVDGESDADKTKAPQP